MNNAIPCITDSDEFRYPPDEPEEDTPYTAAEQRIEWLCEEWADALIDDSAETWSNVRMMIYGAVLANIQTRDRAEDVVLLKSAQEVALAHEMECFKLERGTHA